MKLPDAVYKLPSKKVTLICTHFKNNFVFKFFNTCVCVHAYVIYVHHIHSVPMKVRRG